MEKLLVLFAALLPPVVLWFYIWKKYQQPESASKLVRAVLWSMAICIPVALLELGIEAVFDYYSVYHFVNHSFKTALCILLVPVVTHGIYDAIALSGSVNPYIGGLSFFVLIWFCVKMHKVARTKILVSIEEIKNIPIVK